MINLLIIFLKKQIREINSIINYFIIQYIMVFYLTLQNQIVRKCLKILLKFQKISQRIFSSWIIDNN